MKQLTTALYQRFDFNLRLPYAGVPRLLEGQLILQGLNGVLETWKATSGCVGYQFKGSQRLKGRGCLPSHLQIDRDGYTVALAPVDLTPLKGVEGNFYRILPFEVRVNGIIRGDFGIHRDANVPGSAGCIVITREADWKKFEKTMLLVRGAGIRELPLKVNYLDPV